MVNMLQKKVLRDTRENRWSFLAIVCICSLGIALFSGINMYVTTVETAVSAAYKQANLADYWIYKGEISPAHLAGLRSWGEVQEVQRRKVTDMTLPGASGAVLHLHGLDETATINVPELLEGSGLDGSEANALLLDSRFAEAHKLSVGDRITAGEGEKQTEWLIQGIVRAGEYIYYAPEGLTVPDYPKYGFAYTNASSLPEVPFNEIILTVAEGSTLAQAEISAQIRERLAGATILSRHHQTSYRKVADAMTGIKQIGLLFSLAFFLTGALVTWITVSRMLENQRQHLGTLRSLGYSKKEITGRYALFGVLITLPSMILGWIVARCLIAEFLYRIGMTYYTIEAIGVIPFTPHFFLSALCVTAVTCGGTFFSCRRSLELTPAALMRPKPPAQGHRIFLERITPYWRRLSFSGKIVTRNLFRNKGRMLMGLVGIIGSTSLILCGFGLMNSINGMLDRAFKETVQYDVEIKLRTPSTVEQLADMYNTLSGQHVDATMAFSVYVYGKGDVKALILW